MDYTLASSFANDTRARAHLSGRKSFAHEESKVSLADSASPGWLPADCLELEPEPELEESELVCMQISRRRRSFSRLKKLPQPTGGARNRARESGGRKAETTNLI